MKTCKIEEKMRCYCAATVTAVAAVAAAGTAAYGAYSQSKAQGDAADQAQAALDADKEATYGKKVKLPAWEDDLGDRSYTLGMFDDFQESLPLLYDISRRINTRSNNERNRTSGGTFKSNLAAQGSNIESMLAGEIPEDVADSINRTIAERFGGSFDPSKPGGFAGGISQTGSALGRSLGLTSLDIMEKGMSFAPEWERLVDSFTYTPGKAIADAGTFLSAAQLQLSRDNAEYQAGVNSAIAEGKPVPSIAGSVNDKLRLDTIGSTADANKQKALAGLITAGAGGATSIYNSLKTSPTTTMSASNASAVGTPGTWQSSAYGVR